MTDAQQTSGLAYDDAPMASDCRAAQARLELSRSFARVARAASRPAPSIGFDAFTEVAKPDIDPTVAARRIAAALGLDLV
ncbi:hypothetical protein SAMN04487968_103273 [Nocardioides terrae]|uniref:Uncharacterized protein n=1 Tax=Nocardioides terrae TaxID=574651 RepID=A0A1I1GCS8_9ACTN|nr:hypothetical protein [Nocardioides terrae]SFC07143.1 hypothetical protein SAMN04487968_103273 [Nocardioides terrae]